MPSEAYYLQEDVDRWDDEDYLRMMQREHDERVCDLLTPMWFSEDDLKAEQDKPLEAT